MRVVITLAALVAFATLSVAADIPKEGDKAPPINLPATQIIKVLPNAKDATKLNLTELKGKNVVIFFFPKALTPGCTRESCSFRDAMEQFAKADTVVIGISNDTLEKQQEFTEKHKLNFPLYADTGKEVTKAYGALNDEGRPNRYTFVIDKEGVIRKVYTKVEPESHPEEVLKFIKENLAK